MTSIVLPANYGWVVASGGFIGVAISITSFLAAGHRKAAGVVYPNEYASDITAEKNPKALAFNCAQRGANNPRESLMVAVFGLLLGGLTYPVVAAGAGVAWGLGAIGYYLGYARGDPKLRYSRGGGLLRLATLVLQVLPFITAYKLITQ